MCWLLALLALLVSTGRAPSRAQAQVRAPSERALQVLAPSEPPALAGRRPSGDPLSTSARTSEPVMLVRLAPTARELHAQRTGELERRIERTLLGLPEIAAAHVQLTLPLEAEAPLDRPLPELRATLLLTLRTSSPSDRDYANIVTSALAGRSVALTIVRRPLGAAPPEQLVQLGPFRVEQGSAQALRATLMVTLITNALLALWALRSVRSRSTRRTES